MLRKLERLSVAAAGEIVVNEYRVRAGHLELRTQNDKAIRKRWRKLETDEVMLHLLLNTVVGQWLLQRRGFNTALAERGFRKAKLARMQAA